MSNHFDNELPASRINITLDLATAGASEKKELPLRMLLLNNFSTKQRNLPLEERLPINVTADSLSHVMQKISPQCNFNVSDMLTPQAACLSAARSISVAAEAGSVSAADSPVADVEPDVAAGEAAVAKTIPVSMTFNSMADFKPESIVKSVPQLRRLIATRHILQDLKSRLLNDPQLRRAFDSKKKTLLSKCLTKEVRHDS